MATAYYDGFRVLYVEAFSINTVEIAIDSTLYTRRMWVDPNMIELRWEDEK